MRQDGLGGKCMGDEAPEIKWVGERERETSRGFGLGPPDGENSGGVEAV